MKTSDYRGILYNFNNDYWTANKDIIPAINYAIDRQAIIDAVLLGQGMTAYGPLQRNIYNNENQKKSWSLSDVRWVKTDFTIEMAKRSVS